MYLNQGEIWRLRGKKKCTVSLKDTLGASKTHCQVSVPEQAHSLSLLLFPSFGAVLFLCGQKAAGISVFFFKSLFQKGPKMWFLLRRNKQEGHNAATPEPLCSCLREKGIHQAPEPDSLAV